MLRRVIVCTLAIGALAVPAPVRSQSVRRQIRALFTFGGCGDQFCLAGVNGAAERDEHFNPSADDAGETLIAFLGNSISSGVANAPVGSSSGGTEFRFERGVPIATATSAGPIFAERSQPLGGRRWFVRFDVSQMTFRRLRGVPMNALIFNYAHEGDGDGILGDSSAENDFVRVKMAMDLNLLVASFSVTYGLANGVDLGFTVPFERLAIHGSSQAQIVTSDTLHYFDDSTRSASSRLIADTVVDGASTGLGDVEAHLKINVAQGRRVGVAVFASVRLPTGKTTDFLGSGAFSGRGVGVLSARFGNFDSHLNLGYVVRDASTQNNSLVAALGFDELLSPWATIALDVLGDWEIGASRLHLPPPVVYQAPAPHTMDVTSIPGRGDDLLSLNVGFKFRTQRGIQIITSALFPLRDSALQPTVSWAGGVEYVF